MMSTKVIFITGGATGIGRATVEKFHSKGYKIGFLDANDKQGKALEKTLGESVYFFYGDVRNSSDIKQALIETHKRFGKLDVLFPNAGIHQSNTLLSSSEETWDLVLDINIKGVLRSLKEGIPLLKKEGASIVLMASDQVFIGKRNNFLYGLSKGAIGQMTKSLALDLAQDKIRVNAVCPGTVKTPLSEAAIKRWADRDFEGNTNKAWQLEAQDIPLGKVASAEEVASVVYFLASASASHMTGTLIPIDGGSSIH